MQLKKLSAGFGAETAAFDAPFQEIWDAFFAAQVLVLRGLQLSAGQFLEFARRFGRPEPHVIDQFHHPEHADILVLSNRTQAGRPLGLADAGTYFHTDYSYLEVPARATMLYSIEVPKKGGDTLFANQYAAYDDLPPPMKLRIEGLVALHHYGNRDDLDNASRTVASVLTEDQEEKLAWVKHKLVRSHPATGAPRHAGKVPAAPEIRRWRPRNLGQCVAAALGDADRSRRSAHPVAHYRQRGEEIMKRRLFLAAVAAAFALPAGAQTITLHGASQFSDEHAFTKAMVRFEELVKKYYGKPVNFVLHKNSELGLEKQYFEYLAQGKAVDYAIVSPAHMSTFSKAAPFIDAPFLFRDLKHWNKVLDADVLKPVADEIAQKADVMLIGYAGGGTRNIFVNKPVRNMAELKALKVRVQGAPIWSRTFQAAGMAPTVIAYNEVYNAIQNGVIAAGENEAAGVEQMKFYEVAPHLSMTQHAITIRPLCFSGKTFAKLDKALQAAVLKAGKEAGAYGRKIESSEDEAKLAQMEKEGKLKRVPFAGRDQMKKLVDPVMIAYAKEIGAESILAKINAIK
jgi:tripartite ATP-independent transporter DctP family solute receptor